MSVTSISQANKLILWGKAAGRCEYDGCNKSLYIDGLTKYEFNQAYIAHILADEPGGPRGDAVLSPKLKNDLSNLMLMCDEHHRLIDKVDVAGHPAPRLQKMKHDHEARIELLTSIRIDKRSHVIFYGAKIGEHGTPLTTSEAYAALLPNRYPAQTRPIELGLKNTSWQDRTPEYWLIENQNLEALFRQKVATLKGNDEVQHFSIFGLAPQPLLIRLGTLLSDIYPADVYQRHREPSTWNWQQEAETKEILLLEPKQRIGIPVLKVSLSATVTDQRIHDTLSDKSCIWTITIDNPNNDFLKTRELLTQFRMICRRAFDRIKAAHGEKSQIHVCPAMPVSAAVELGRVWMPKADLPLIIYDQNQATGGFTKVMEISNSNRGDSGDAGSQSEQGGIC
ncbi:MAG: SAVED domain-containing protein [Ignavibacteriales bacterium]|nr:SAVED domain-containing protein [Ignavibacteriales bacterium]